jgi:membrane protease YdiL (CAAX protease family)
MGEDYIRFFGAALLFVAAADLFMLIAWSVNRSLVTRGKARPLFSPTWSLGHVWIALQVFALAMGAVGILLLVPFMVATGGLTDPTRWMQRNPLPILISLVPQNAILVAIVVVTVTKLYGERLSSIGFRLFPERRDLVLGTKYGLATLAALFALQFAVTFGIAAVAGEGALKQITEDSKRLGIEGLMEGWLGSKWIAGLLLIGGGILAPIGEEFFFRGFVFNAGRRRLGLWGGAILSSALFALVHLGPLSVILIFPVGLALAFAYHATGSLWVPIVMHGIFNSLQIAAAALVAGYR